jgi:hypothetical protein
VHIDELVPGRPSRTILPAGRVPVTLVFTGADGEKHEEQRKLDLVAGEETKVEVGDE